MWFNVERFVLIQIFFDPTQLNRWSIDDLNVFAVDWVVDRNRRSWRTTNMLTTISYFCVLDWILTNITTIIRRSIRTRRVQQFPVKFNLRLFRIYDVPSFSLLIIVKIFINFNKKLFICKINYLCNCKSKWRIANLTFTNFVEL